MSQQSFGAAQLAARTRAKIKREKAKLPKAGPGEFLPKDRFVQGKRFAYDQIDDFLKDWDVRDRQKKGGLIQQRKKTPQEPPDNPPWERVRR